LFDSSKLQPNFFDSFIPQPTHELMLLGGHISRGDPQHFLDKLLGEQLGLPSSVIRWPEYLKVSYDNQSLRGSSVNSFTSLAPRCQEANTGAPLGTPESAKFEVWREMKFIFDENVLGQNVSDWNSSCAL
jgi:hypothetical protein